MITWNKTIYLHILTYTRVGIRQKPIVTSCSKYCILSLQTKNNGIYLRSNFFVTGSNILQYSLRRLPAGVATDPCGSVGLPIERHDHRNRYRRQPHDVTRLWHRTHCGLWHGVRLHRHTNVSHATRSRGDHVSPGRDETFAF